MKSLPDNSVDSIVTDPPYGLSFMGKKWDYDVPSVDVWSECLRVLKPGGHLIAFAGTRTQHRMACRIEDAGFDIRDMIAWVYGSGFPKSLDVSKAIDKAAGAEREVTGERMGDVVIQGGNFAAASHRGVITLRNNPATESAKQWQGWGTALKPSLEPITLARKPFTGTVADSVLAHGTGAINVDGCRVETDENLVRASGTNENAVGSWGMRPGYITTQPEGRWPANFIHDGSDEVSGLMGDAARFFYCAKASVEDRDAGLCKSDFMQSGVFDERPSGSSNERRNKGEVAPRKNHHPTVKPTDLMRYLCRLVTPPKGVVLDPFTGSGSTGKAAALEGFKFIGAELDEAYFRIAIERIKHAVKTHEDERSLWEAQS